MKTVIVAMLLATAIASPSYADAIKVERPCGSKCLPAQPPAASITADKCCAVGTVPFNDLSKRESTTGSYYTYESQSRMVIRSKYGTTVIDSTYHSSR